MALLGSSSKEHGSLAFGGNYMRNTSPKLICVTLLSLSVFANPVIAQDTNAYTYSPATRLEAFVTNTDTVVIRGSAEIGVVSADTGAITVKCREISETSTGHKEVGISVDLGHNQQSKEMRYIDYDELEPLINALTYLNKVDWSITSLNSFDAAITTRSGFRASAFSSKRSSAIEFAVRTAGTGNPPILLSRDQLAEFRGLLEQARSKLDSIHQK
jgi:hypothetical protein